MFEEIKHHGVYESDSGLIEVEVNSGLIGVTIGGAKQVIAELGVAATVPLPNGGTIDTYQPGQRRDNWLAKIHIVEPNGRRPIGGMGFFLLRNGEQPFRTGCFIGGLEDLVMPPASDPSKETAS